MFQTFDAPAPTASTRARLIVVRGLMDRIGIDALLVPRTDAHQGEYIPASAERLRWLTGFSGSAGLSIVTRSRALLVVDGRYVTQASNQVDTRLFEVVMASEAFESEAARWLGRYSRSGDTMGFDPWLHTIDQIDVMTRGLEKTGVKFKRTIRNVIDQAWGKERPPKPAGMIDCHDQRFAGAPSDEKIAAVQAELRTSGDSALLVSQSDNVSWLFNIRGSDVPHTPVVLAFAIVPAKGKPELFAPPDRLTEGARAQLERVAILVPPAEIATRLRHRVSAAAQSGTTLRIDTKTASYWFQKKCNSHAKSINRGTDPITALKAVKNETEIAGTRAAHRRDAVAMCRFLAWFDRMSAEEQLDEIVVVKRLEEFRAETGHLRDISFDSIVGSGPNGAIVHYRVTEATNRALKKDELLLVDSGGQYLDGTTDVTRTVVFGRPTLEMKRHFTLVLKGHIAIATARFPRGTRGLDLDPLARIALWQHGLDYDHGTGHGVGSFLSVHEGPQSISRRGLARLEPGMICSNEPGYYKPGHYGIRIESLCLVEAPRSIEGGERDMMSFETLTLVPIDTSLVEVAALSGAERKWLNDYHDRVHKMVGPELGPEDAHWLQRATRPI